MRKVEAFIIAEKARARGEELRKVGKATEDFVGITNYTTSYTRMTLE